MGVLGEETRHHIVGVAPTFDGIHDASRLLRIRRIQNVSSDSGQNDSVQPTRRIDHDAKKGHGTQGEPNGVARLIGKETQERPGEIGVCLGIVRLGRCSVSDQVNPYDPASSVLEESAET